MGDVDQKIEQAKIIMNENIFKDIDPEELAMKLNISYSWFRKVLRIIRDMRLLSISRNLSCVRQSSYWLALPNR